VVRLTKAMVANVFIFVDEQNSFRVPTAADTHLNGVVEVSNELVDFLSKFERE
jgi:hypothetical protein